jgi:hypothetical protein
MSEVRTYQVVVLPRGEVAAMGCSLVEATAWMHAYNEIMGPGPQQAVIAAEPARAALQLRPMSRAA